VGDQLSGVAQNIGNFRDSFIDPLRHAIDDLANPTAEFAKAGTDPITKILYKLLGPEPGGLHLLQDSNGDHLVDIRDVVFVSNMNTPGVALKDLYFHWNFK